MNLPQRHSRFSDLVWCVILTSLGLVACKTPSHTSNVLVDGENTRVTTGTPAVVYLESPEPCTGTFIGKDTLIAAAHCVDVVEEAIIFIDENRRPHVSTKIWHHGVIGQAVLSGLVPHVVQRDFVIAQFSGLSRTHTAEMGFETLKAGQKTKMIGYSLSLQTPSYRRGDKVEAEAIISKVSDKGVRFRGFPAVNGGDSGGPLLLSEDGKVYGVASFGQIVFPNENRTSFYALLSHPDNVKLLRKAYDEGASIDISSLPEDIYFQNSDEPISGVFKGFQICASQDDNNVLDYCDLTMKFNSDNTVLMSAAPGTEQSLKYKQIGDRLLVSRGPSRIDENNRSTFSEFSIFRNSNVLISASGSIFSRTGSSPTQPNSDDQEVTTSTPGQIIMSCESTDGTRSLTFFNNNRVRDKVGPGRSEEHSFSIEIAGGRQLINIQLSDGEETYLKNARLLIPQPGNVESMHFRCTL